MPANILDSQKSILFRFQLNLSHNKIPFVTRKMFPESRWVPYKLTHIDLSHNVMPVLTREILTGTKHLQYLNVSYNMLADIRKGKDKVKSIFKKAGILTDIYINIKRNASLKPYYGKCPFCVGVSDIRFRVRCIVDYDWSVI